MGARKSRRARGRHACTEGTRVSPSRAPVLSWAHYFQVKCLLRRLTNWLQIATALNRFITKCDGQLLQIAKAFWLQSATWLIIATLTYLIHISHFRKRLSLPQPQGFTEKFANIRGLFLRRIRGTFEWYLHPTSTLIFEILVQSHRFLRKVRQLLITARMLRPAMSVFIVSEGCIYTFTRTRFQFRTVSRRVKFWERLDCKTVGFFLQSVA